MARLADMIEREAGDEQVIWAVIGEHDNDTYRSEGGARFNEAPLNRKIPWGDAKPFLSYSYDNSWGGANCHPVYAWTETRVIFVTEYDGSTGVMSIPRDACDVAPEFT